MSFHPGGAELVADRRISQALRHDSHATSDFTAAGDMPISPLPPAHLARARANIIARTLGAHGCPGRACCHPAHYADLADCLWLLGMTGLDTDRERNRQ